MCGRFTQALSWQELQRLADLIGQPRNLPPRYNIAPTTRIEVLVVTDGGTELRPMRWGLIPTWWKKTAREVPSTFNARTDKLTSPMWRSSFKAHRCIIPASGFYEWTGPKAKRIPHYFTAANGEPLALAGLWASWTDPDGEQILSASIVVGEANVWMRPFHDRQPLILAWKDAGAWMRGDAPQDLIRPAPEDALSQHVVSTRVNKSGAYDDDPSLIAAA